LPVSGLSDFQETVYITKIKLRKDFTRKIQCLPSIKADLGSHYTSTQVFMNT